ncbi:PREDICTED: G-protein coupled receptor Mth2-like isoform X1 [Dinoponera quadriceps]|uniref:G-protein coupled receptor Mth2-like isoform X1 n=1 Tax=Dinoponera quadriceps TaxID=609295 RepID=A0A6P3Y7U1_DINQU|nr:PREDICTED: G-protein coupled receptor Mth2-like isoform X1 [Dinoponera quadriceps]
MRRGPVVWCAFLFAVARATDRRGSPPRDEPDDTMRYQPYVNFTGGWNREENSTRAEDEDEEPVEHEFRSQYVKNADGEGDRDGPDELRSIVSQMARPGNNANGMCNGTTCQIPICCELGYRMIKDVCTPDEGDYVFPEVQELGRKVDDIFELVVKDPCKPVGRYLFNTELYPDDEYVILTNGSIYQPRRDSFIDPTTYCFAVVKMNKYELTICFDESSETVNITQEETGIPVGMIVSLPFLLLTFIVYCILPELCNMHGYILRAYIGSLFVAYFVLGIFQLVDPNSYSQLVCIGSAFIIHFSFLASFFWLNVMCFDIWWTFGGFRSLQGSVKQRERKKFIIYSIYAWGCATVLTVVCAIMDFVPTVPKTFIRPEFGHVRCWYTTDEARAVYFYGPMSVTVICNICLFISTALKILRHQKDTDHHLRGSESRRHDDNKQWFNLYLKLFIVMGINWSMEIISWLFKSAPAYVWYLSDLTNTLQGVIIFIIFVWKDKIKRLLLKRFGCQEQGLFSRNSTRSGCHSTVSRTCTTTSGGLPLQEKINPYQTNCRSKNSSDETDCP